MKIIKSFFSKLKNEEGFGILGLITIVGLISVAVGLHSVGEYSIGQREKVQKPFITVQNLPDIGEDDVDIGKEYLEGRKALVDGFKKLGEDAIGIAVDDTAGLGIIKEIGVFDLPKDKEVPEDKKEEQEDSGSDRIDPIFIQGLLGAVEGAAGVVDILPIEEKLSENNLPTDIITQDITKIVINVANQLGSSDSEVADIIDISIDVMKDLTNKNKNENIDNDSAATLEIIKEKLSEINKLEDEETINKRKEHNLSVLEKEQLEKEIELYEHYKDTDTVIISNEMYEKIQQRLDHLNDKIDALEKELQEDKEKSEEESGDQNIEDISTDEEESEEITEEVTGEVIILNGTLSDPEEGGTTKMSMTIDLKTGTVSGIIFIRIDNEYMKFDADMPISGSMNLETREINAQSGEVKLTGILSADGNRASGTLLGEDGNLVWSVSR